MDVLYQLSYNGAKTFFKFAECIKDEAPRQTKKVLESSDFFSPGLEFYGIFTQET